MTPPLLGTASKLLPRMVDEQFHCTRGSYDVKSSELLPRLATSTSPQARHAIAPRRHDVRIGCRVRLSRRYSRGVGRWAKIEGTRGCRPSQR